MLSDEEKYDQLLEEAYDITEGWEVTKRKGLDFIFENPKYGFVSISISAMLKEDALIELAKLLSDYQALG